MEVRESETDGAYLKSSALGMEVRERGGISEKFCFRYGRERERDRWGISEKFCFRYGSEREREKDRDGAYLKSSALGMEVRERERERES
jgi:hypothetical protein